jgi:hypothetical protein
MVVVFSWLQLLHVNLNCNLSLATRFNRKRLVSSAKLGLASLLITIVLYNSFGAAIFLHLPDVKEANISSKQLNYFMRNIPGVALFLVPNNNYRLLTPDTSIYKGGMNVASEQWNWGWSWSDSWLVHSMFPDRWYAIGYTKNASIPENLIYTKVIFSSLPNKLDEAVDLNKMIFGVDIQKFECSLNIMTRLQTIHGCTVEKNLIKPLSYPLSDLVEVEKVTKNHLRISLRKSNITSSDHTYYIEVQESSINLNASNLVAAGFLSNISSGTRFHDFEINDQMSYFLTLRACMSSQEDTCSPYYRQALLMPNGELIDILLNKNLFKNLRDVYTTVSSESLPFNLQAVRLNSSEIKLSWNSYDETVV